MDDSARQSLKRYISTAVLIFAVIAGVVWTVPMLLEKDHSAPESTPIAATKPTVSPDTLDRFMQDAIRRIGATEVISREDDDGVVRGIFQLPKDAENAMIGQRLRRFATEADVELYASPVDGLDLEIRAYAGPSLRQQILLLAHA